MTNDTHANDIPANDIPATDDQPTAEEAKLGFFQIMGSTIAAAFGVQSSKNRKRDFEQGRAGPFIAAGVLFTVLFVLAVYTVVTLVLPS